MIGGRIRYIHPDFHEPMGLYRHTYTKIHRDTSTSQLHTSIPILPYPSPYLSLSFAPPHSPFRNHQQTHLHLRLDSTQHPAVISARAAPHLSSPSPLLVTRDLYYVPLTSPQLELASSPPSPSPSPSPLPPPLIRVHAGGPADR
jgi:hypothetical protein